MTFAPTFRLAVAAALLVAAPAQAWEVQSADERAPEEFAGVGVTEHLGDQVDLDLTFTDHDGQRVRLGDFFADGKPVLLTLNYYACPSLCTLQLNALTEALRDVDLDGDEFRVVTLSIDPRESARLANAKREAYLELLDRDDIDWHFLVGGELPIRMLAEQVGFGYRYDRDSGEFAHQAATYFLAPNGTITRYLYGIAYLARDVKFALIEAGEGRVGSTLDRIIMTCFHYVDGSYAPWAFGFMRLGGLMVVAMLGILLIVLWRRERHRGEAEAEA